MLLRLENPCFVVAQGKQWLASGHVVNPSMGTWDETSLFHTVLKQATASPVLACCDRNRLDSMVVPILLPERHNSGAGARSRERIFQG